MNLYFIKAELVGHGCIDNQDLWVRAESEDRALELWDGFYEIVDAWVGRCPSTGPVTRAEAEAMFDVGFSIELKKTYAEPAPAEGAIDWDTAKRLMVEGL